ncbi:hypothetical protein LSPH26S_03808 [Lysinibacillus sphaericus]
MLVRHGYYLPDANADPTLGPHLGADRGGAGAFGGGAAGGVADALDALYVSPIQRAHIRGGDGEDASRTAFRGGERSGRVHAADAAGRDHGAGEAGGHGRVQGAVRPAIRALLTPASGHERTVICMPCNVIRNMVVRALGVDPQAWLEMSVGNASITRIRVGWHVQGDLRRRRRSPSPEPAHRRQR